MLFDTISLFECDSETLCVSIHVTLNSIEIPYSSWWFQL
jgi:hypothetical protein